MKFTWAVTMAIVSMVIFLLTFSALAVGFDKDGGRDWDYFQADLLSASRSIFDHGELPFWMPYRAGGHDAFADPQSAWFSPFGALVFLTGFPVGARLFLAFCSAFGGVGAMLLCRQLRLSKWSALLVPVILCASMPMGLYAAGGLPNFSVGLAILPWLVLLVNQQQFRSCVIAGLLLALALYCGDPNHFVWHALYLCCFGAALAVLRRDWRPVRDVVLTGISAAVFGAAKMVPMWLMLREYPRPVEADNFTGTTLRLAYNAFLKPFPPYMKIPNGEFVCLLKSGELVSYNLLEPHRLSEVQPGTYQVWVTVGCYIGWGVTALALLGTVALSLSMIRQWNASTSDHTPEKKTASPPDEDAQQTLPTDHSSRTLIIAIGIASLIFFCISFGSGATPSLWDLLHKLPVFSSMKGPTRLIVYALLPISLLAAFGFDCIVNKAAGKLDEQLLSLLLGVVVFLVVLDVHLPARSLFSIAFCEPHVEFSAETPGFSQHDWSDFVPNTTRYGPPVTLAVRANQGFANGYGVFHTDTNVKPRSAENYLGEVFVQGDGRGTVSDFRVNSRFISFAYDLPEDATVVINQNYYSGWKAVVPTETSVVPDSDGLISITIPQGEGVAKLRYTPPGLWAAILVTLVGTPALLASGWFLERKRNRTKTETKD